MRKTGERGRGEWDMKKFVAILIAYLLIVAELEGQGTSFDENKLQTRSDSILNFMYPNLYSMYGSNHYLRATDVKGIKNIDSATFEKYSYRWILYYDFFTTLTALHTTNSLYKSEADNLYFYYNLDIKSNLEFRKVKWDFYLFNDYGLRYFFDSVTTKTQDQLTFKNQLYYPIYKSKLFIALSANTQTQLYNTHRYRTDSSGEQERFLYGGFMSPGVILYSGGITYEAGGNAIIHLGLGSSKVTKIKNQKIFDTRNEEELSGLKKGERKKSEWGITLTSTVPLQHLNKHLHWEFYESVFVPVEGMNEIKNYSFEINNVIHLLLLKYVRLSFRTKLSYNYERFAKPVIQNQVSLGFYLSNHL